MSNLKVIIALVFSFIVSSCNKTTTVIDVDTSPPTYDSVIAPNYTGIDSIVIIPYVTGPLRINLDNISGHDVEIYFERDGGLGGGYSTAMSLKIMNPNWNTFVQNDLDTICCDTSYVNSIRTFHYSNCTGGPQTYQILDTVFSNQYSLDNINTHPTQLNSKDSVLIYKNNYVQHLTRFPDAAYYNVSQGSSNYSNGEYLLFIDNQNNKKAAQLLFKNQYLYLVKIIDI